MKKSEIIFKNKEWRSSKEEGSEDNMKWIGNRSVILGALKFRERKMQWVYNDTCDFWIKIWKNEKI